MSIYNIFGYKIPSDPAPATDCLSQQSHSPTCGTSLSLMKRLMYTQLFYDSVYFAFEGGWEYPPHAAGNRTGISPIGTLQQQAKQFFSSPDSPDLGVHVPTVAVMLDFYAGFARPCDAAFKGYTPASWGEVPWDAADMLADSVFELLLPGYRAGALRHDEQGYLSPTPYGDAADVLLSDASAELLCRYDTLVLPHRLTSEPAETLRKLTLFVSCGGNLVLTASTLHDLGGSVLNITIGPCAAAPAGTRVAASVNGTHVTNTTTEPEPFVLCPVVPPPRLAPGVVVSPLATIVGSGVVAALRLQLPAVEGGSGSVTVIGAGNYALSTTATARPTYQCKVDDDDSLAKSPYPMVGFAATLLRQAVAAAALFDLGDRLSWVPKRIADGKYALAVTNSELAPVPLSIRSRVGAIASVTELKLDQREKTATGYLPHGFEGRLPALGQNTPTQIAGADTRLFIVTLATDDAVVLPAAVPGPASRVLLTLAADAGDLRSALLRRPSFETTFSGAVLDWTYLESRGTDTLRRDLPWWRARRLDVVVDFTSGTTLFPGLRLIDDMHMYWLDSMSRIEAVFAKMAIIGSANAVFTLHGTSELPPANFTSTPAASMRSSLTTLVSVAKRYNVTCHLRTSQRNAGAAGAALAGQLAFAASVPGLKLAVSLPFATNVPAVDALFHHGAATILLASGSWQAAKGPNEGAPLSTLDPAARDRLRALVAAATAAGGLVVLDAVPTDRGDAGRAQELADAALLRGS